MYGELFNQMRADGYDHPPEHAKAGEITRFSNGKACYLILFSDGNGAVYGNWRTGDQNFWFVNSQQTVTKSQRLEFERKIEVAKAEREKERVRLYEQKSELAQLIYKQAISAQFDHPYLIAKQVRPHCAKSHKAAYLVNKVAGLDAVGMLVVPLVDFSDQIMSLQFLSKQGKRFLPGGKKKGCYIPVQRGDNRYVIIAEGFATAATIAESNCEATVLAACDAGNLLSVATEARKKWPDSEIIIAGDDDRLTSGNPGKTKAREAAIACGGMLAMPKWPDDAPDHFTDFNDLACWINKEGKSCQMQ